MPLTYYSSSSPGEISISDGEVDGTDYLLSSTMRFEENIFHVFGEFSIYLSIILYPKFFCEIGQAIILFALFLSVRIFKICALFSSPNFKERV